jgi:hypothetical protein
MPTVDYLPVAVAAGANVDSQADFDGSGYQETGVTSGIILSKWMNKMWRQSSMVGAAVANFIANTLSENVLDDGNLANLTAQFTAAVSQAGSGIETVAFSGTPTFNAALFTKFDMTLTGNVTASSLVGQQPGQLIYFVIHQDGTGGRTFAWPSAVPGGTIDPGVSKTSTQGFLVDAAGTLRPIAGMTSS